MSKNIDKRVWGVLGKQQTYFSPQKQVQGKTKTPLNANAFDSWDAKRSRFKRVDGYENAIQQGGAVPQISSTPIITTPTPTPSFTPTNTPTNTPTPSITPEIDCIWSLTDELWENNSNLWNVCQPVITPTNTGTPTNTPTSSNTPTPTPSAPAFNPLTLNPMIWVDFNDASTLSLRSGQFVQSASNKGNWTAFTGFSQTTAANQPSWSASTMGTGMSAITISNDFLENTTIPTGSTWNTFAVLKYGGTDPFAPLQVASTFGATQSWSNLYAQRQLDRYANFKIEGSDEYRRAFDGYTGFNTTHIAQGYMSNSALTIVDYFNINNSAQTETIEANTNTTTGWPGAITNSPIFRIINNEEFGASIPGEIGEIYMFDKELTSTQQTNLINYLKTKWGIA